jgi:hypothetical protein
MIKHTHFSARGERPRCLGQGADLIMLKPLPNYHPERSEDAQRCSVVEGSAVLPAMNPPRANRRSFDPGAQKRRTRAQDGNSEESMRLRSANAVLPH